MWLCEFLPYYKTIAYVLLPPFHLTSPALPQSLALVLYLFLRLSSSPNSPDFVLVLIFYPNSLWHSIVYYVVFLLSFVNIKMNIEWRFLKDRVSLTLPSMSLSVSNSALHTLGTQWLFLSSSSPLRLCSIHYSKTAEWIFWGWFVAEQINSKWRLGWFCLLNRQLSVELLK